ncbi:type II secretion system F family protein [Arthrobacter bambusae]|uniref:type II secretion system F family protein n=1 Tax=Arthrobacter bambusae TaxID=1338426 RepID=UPI002783FC1E|nr:type II secretion system F family protein [Arthrobacter bambusae]MDQ0211841.1 tight adherence protein B [Arthrobacter bambusae]MDQ0236407.1 tight adherence protein B [Arthrobacter bambusae]
MSDSGVQSMMLAAGLGLVYVALLLLVLVVLKSKRTLDVERRRPDSPIRTSALTLITDGARNAIQARVRPRSGGYLSRARLDAAGLKKQPADYILIAGIVAVFAGAIGFLLGGLVFTILMCLVAMVSLVAFLSVLTSRRTAKFDEQVPDALQMLSGGMRAGHSLLRAVDAVAQESDAPMSEEMSRIVNETRIGRDLGESLNDVAMRTRSEDFGWIAQAIEIHREVGGDLAEVLDHVGETIRDRNQIRRQVRALSAEGRMSALVLLALPVVMFIALLFINPSYAHTFTSTLPGYLMIAAAVVMLSVGAFWLSRLIKPKY